MAKFNFKKPEFKKKDKEEKPKKKKDESIDALNDLIKQKCDDASYYDANSDEAKAAAETIKTLMEAKNTNMQAVNQNKKKLDPNAIITTLITSVSGAACIKLVNQVERKDIIPKLTGTLLEKLIKK